MDGPPDDPFEFSRRATLADVRDWATSNALLVFQGVPDAGVGDLVALADQVLWVHSTNDDELGRWLAEVVRVGARLLDGG